MKSLKNVGEIRFVFDIPNSQDSIKNVADKISKDDYDKKRKSLEFLRDNVKRNNLPDFSDSSWECLDDKRNQHSFVSLIRTDKYVETMYAFILFRENNTNQVGISYRRPHSSWIDKATEIKEGSKTTEENIIESKKNKIVNKMEGKIHHNHNMDKHNIEKNNKVNEDKSNSKDRIKDSKNDIEIDKIDELTVNRSETNIDKKTLITLLKARLANVLRVNNSRINPESNELSDFYYISEGYPKIADIIKDIHDEKSLHNNINRLPYNITDDEIDDIVSESNIRNSNDGNQERNIDEDSVKNRSFKP